MHLSKRQERALRKSPYYEADSLPQIVHRYKCWQLFLLALLPVLLSVVLFILSFTAGLPLPIGQLYSSAGACPALYPRLFYPTPLGPAPFTRLCVGACPDDSSPQLACNSSLELCRLAQAAPYSQAAQTGVTRYPTTALFGACLASTSPYPLQATLLASNAQGWLQNDFKQEALATGLIVLCVCLGVYLVALAVTCLPGVLVALVPLLMLAGMFIVFYILMAQEVSCGSVASPLPVSPYQAALCLQYRVFGYCQLCLLGLGITVIILRFDSLRLAVLMIRALSPFFSAYVWQLNFNLLMGAGFLSFAALFLLGLNQLLLMPPVRATATGPFAATGSWTADWAPVYQLALLLFITEYLLCFVKLTNANVAALWYFEESEDMAVHEPLLRSLRRSLKRVGVLAITTAATPLVLLMDGLYWLLFSGRGVDSLRDQQLACLSNLCACCGEYLDWAFSLFNKAGIPLLAIFDLGSFESNQRAYSLHRRSEFKAYGAGTLLEVVLQLSTLTASTVAGYFLVRPGYAPVALLVLLQLLCCSFCRFVCSHYCVTVDTVLASILVDIEADGLDEHCPEALRGTLREFMDELEEQLLDEEY
jgi:hypothetical protein